MRYFWFLTLLSYGCSTDRDLTLSSNSQAEPTSPMADLREQISVREREYEPFQISPPRFDERFVRADLVDLDDPHRYEVLEMIALHAHYPKEQSRLMLMPHQNRDHYTSIDCMDEAIRDYERLIERQDPCLDERPEFVHARLYCNRGIVRWCHGQKEKAVQDFSRAIQLDPDRWEYYFHRWKVQYLLDRFSDAEQDRRAGHELKPEMFPYRVHGGVI